MTLKDKVQSLMCVSHVLPVDVSGDGSGFGSDNDDDENRNGKISKKDMGRAVAMASTLTAVFKATGLAAGGGGQKQKSSELEAAEVLVKEKEALVREKEALVKEKEAEALGEQAKATKAASFKELAECGAASEELRAKALAAWAATLGLT